MNEPFFRIIKLEKKQDYGKFSIEPLPQGFGDTLGNSLRRVLLAFIPGTAVSRIKIKGVRHQFSTIPGLREDIVEFILNIKKIQFNLEGEEETKLTLSKKGKGEITAKDITLPANVTIANTDEYLGFLATEQAKLGVTIWIERGVGYIPSEERVFSELGIIPVDSHFSPVRRVSIKVEETRVGRATNYDKLILEIWTNGAADPHEVLKQASKILVSYFEHVVNPKTPAKKESGKDSIPRTILNESVEELELSVRVTNALRKGGYEIVADFQGKTRQDLEKVRNLGAKSIKLIEKKLKDKGIELVQ